MIPEELVTLSENQCFELHDEKICYAAAGKRYTAHDVP